MKARMEISGRDLLEIAADAFVLFVSEGDSPADALPRGAAAAVRAEAGRRRFKGAKGEILEVPLPAPRGPARVLLAVGLGKREEFGPERLRLAAAAAARRSQALRARRVALALPAAPAGSLGPRPVARAVMEGALVGTYRFERYLTDPGRRAAPVERFVLAAGPAAPVARAVLPAAEEVAAALALARDLVNEPAAVVTPAAFAREAQRAARRAPLRATVLGPRELRRERMGALLAVAQGSDQPPRLVHLVYRPRRAKAKLALVGKGVTFDSGGYDIKTADGMLDMKCDMSGAAAVLAATVALARLGAPVEVHAVMGLVENLVSGGAYKPGDVLTTRRGKTVEINNTDAEGRLVLADALDYVRTRIRPDAIVDVATLTGACVVALGPMASGVMGNDQALIDRVLAAARASGEKMWPLPLYDEYLEQLKSDIADLRNTGGRWGGALTAGLFLREFVERTQPWVHLDIAGPAFASADHAFWGKGGTGAAAATLIELGLAW
ncbi:MAG: leucyl aminopeptidase [Acidobacteria bacterium]|jgi:leucyl aminopeptidase|nr:leucyl aminopeptidase [Acidobacteriota bacterium]